MPPEKTDQACLWDMLDAARAVAEFVRGKTYADYLNSRMLRGAVERHVEIIGQAAYGVSMEFRQAHPKIPWKGIIGQRNVLAHDYGEIQHEKIWLVATDFIPRLIEDLAPLVAAQDNSH